MLCKWREKLFFALDSTKQTESQFSWNIDFNHRWGWEIFHLRRLRLVFCLVWPTNFVMQAWMWLKCQNGMSYLLFCDLPFFSSLYRTHVAHDAHATARFNTKFIFFSSDQQPFKTSPQAKRHLSSLLWLSWLSSLDNFHQKDNFHHKIHHHHHHHHNHNHNHHHHLTRVKSAN